MIETTATYTYTNGNAAGLDPLNHFLNAVGYNGTRSNSNIKCHCPAHDDGRESLSVTTNDNGDVLLYCHAGCSAEKIVTTVNMKMTELFADSKAKTAKPKTNSKGRIVVAYDYTDLNGALLYQVVRYEPKKFLQRWPDGKGGWIWDMRGVVRVPYRLPDLATADPGTWIFVTEGEKDVDKLRAAGLAATCNVGGAGKWQADHNQHFKGRKVCILPDNDKPGRDHAANVAQQLTGVASRVVVVKLACLPEKGDTSDWLAAGGKAYELPALPKPCLNTLSRLRPTPTQKHTTHGRMPLKMGVWPCAKN